MLSLHQIRTLIIRPTLIHLDLYSESAENLLIGTAIQESGLFYVKQLKGGPAVGLFQMEPATHDDIWASFLKYKPELANKIHDIELPHWYGKTAEEMIGNLYYATAMCRVHYYRVKEALPRADNTWELGRYWKQYYNTEQGKGNIRDFVFHYEKAHREDLQS